MSKPTKRRANATRSQLAFRTALANNWPREMILKELGISMATYYRWLDQSRAASEAKS